MGHEHSTVCLGFAEGRFPVGTHLCQIYSDVDERDRSLRTFLASGLRDRERAACFSKNLDKESLIAFLEEEGIAFQNAVEKGDLTLAETAEVYFRDGRFDPDRMLALLRAFQEDSLAGCYAAARVIGEMDPAIQDVPGGERLGEYESRVTMLVREHPVTAVCQYDARAFDGAMILDVLKVHPLMVVNGAVVRNPFFIRPEDYLESRCHIGE